MPPLTETRPEELIHDLAMSLWRDRAMLRDLARPKAWEPSIEDCQRLAERQVELLRRHGVLRAVREVAPAHSMRPAGSGDLSATLPVWRLRAAQET
jgi:hypothetical protein